MIRYQNPAILASNCGVLPAWIPPREDVDWYRGKGTEKGFALPVVEQAGRHHAGSTRSGDDRQNDCVQRSERDRPHQCAEAAAAQFETAYEAGGQGEDCGVDEDAEKAEGQNE